MKNSKTQKVGKMREGRREAINMSLTLTLTLMLKCDYDCVME